MTLERRAGATAWDLNSDPMFRLRQVCRVYRQVDLLVFACRSCLAQSQGCWFPAMGCANTSPLKEEIANEIRLYRRESFHTWDWKLPEDQPSPPNRRTHERHLRHLKVFMAEMKEKPWELSLEVERRRKVQGAEKAFPHGL